MFLSWFWAEQRVNEWQEQYKYGVNMPYLLLCLFPSIYRFVLHKRSLIKRQQSLYGGCDAKAWANIYVYTWQAEQKIAKKRLGVVLLLACNISFLLLSFICAESSLCDLHKLLWGAPSSQLLPFEGIYLKKAEVSSLVAAQEAAPLRGSFWAPRMCCAKPSGRRCAFWMNGGLS